MIFVTAPPPPPDAETAESYRQQLPSQLIAHEEPTWLERPRFAFRRSVLPIEGGRVLLRLTETPLIEVDPATQECEVLGWGVHMPCHAVPNLPKAMARRFLDLFSKADAGRLDEADQKCWMGILDQVDFQSFCLDRAAPHYLEGTLVRTEPVCLIEWHDGERQQISREVARTLGALQPGDEFGAYVKLGRENAVSSIERIILLAAAGE